MKYSTITKRFIVCDEAPGEEICVSEDDDGLGLIQITETIPSVRYLSKITVDLDRAKLLLTALRLAIGEMS